MWDIPTPFKFSKRGGLIIANIKRKILLHCPVTDEERRLIEKKMAQLPTKRIGAYLRKMAIDGFIIYTDTSNIKEFTKELQAIGRNVNQMAKQVNSTDSVYKEVRILNLSGHADSQANVGCIWRGT